MSRSPSPSTTQPPHSVWLASSSRRLLQCCTGTNVISRSPSRVSCHQSYSSTRVMPSVANHAFNPSGTRKRGLPCGIAARRITDIRVEMIVVIVRDQHDVDARQLGDVDRQRHDPLRAREAERRRALGEHRIEQDVLAGEPDEHRRMPDPRHRRVGLRRVAAPRRRSSRRECSSRPAAASAANRRAIAPASTPRSFPCRRAGSCCDSRRGRAARPAPRRCRHASREDRGEPQAHAQDGASEPDRDASCDVRSESGTTRRAGSAHAARGCRARGLDAHPNRHATPAPLTRRTPRIAPEAARRSAGSGRRPVSS